MTISNRLPVFVVLTLLSVARAQFNFTEIGNSILGSGPVTGIICTTISVAGNLFTNEIAALINSQLSGTEEDVPDPYDKFVIDGVDPPSLNNCNGTIVINFRFTQKPGAALIKDDTEGRATVKGMYNPGLTFFAQNDTFIPGVQACISGLYVSEMDIEEEGVLYEDFAREYINRELDDPECSVIIGGEEEGDEDADADEDDGDGDGGIIGGDGDGGVIGGDGDGGVIGGDGDGGGIIGGDGDGGDGDGGDGDGGLPFP